MNLATKRKALAGAAALGSLLGLLLFTAPPRAAAGITLFFDPPDSMITLTMPPETLTVAFRIDTGADTLKGYSVVLEYDSTIVKAIDVAPGPFLAGGACDSSFFYWFGGAVGDSVAVDGAALGCLGRIGTGTLFEMQFIAVTTDSGQVSPLTCRNVRLRNPHNDSLDVYTCEPGSIRVEFPPISVEAASWGRMKALYR